MNDADQVTKLLRRGGWRLTLFFWRKILMMNASMEVGVTLNAEKKKPQSASLTNLYKVKDSRFGVHHDEPGEERDGDDSSEHVDNEDPRRNRQKSTGLVEICANSNGRQPRSAPTVGVTTARPRRSLPLSLQRDSPIL